MTGETRRFRSLTRVRMQFYQLVQVFANIPSALGTSHHPRLSFVHQYPTSRTEPSPSEAIACLDEAELLRFLSFAYEA
jgi:hypothetical protein